MAQTNVQAFSGDVEISSNLAVTGNAYVSSNLEVGTANLFVDTVNSRVGIGTSNPGYPLQVDGTIKLSTGTNDASGSEFNIDGTVGHIRRKIGGNGVSYTSYDDHQFYTNAAGGAAENGGQSMVIKSTGNVGIGRTNPGVQLSVNGNIQSINDAGSHDIMGLVSAHYGDFFHIGAWNAAGSSSKSIVMNYLGGNVGIGINNPGYKLHTEGSLHFHSPWSASSSITKIQFTSGSFFDCIPINTVTGYRGYKVQIRFDPSPGNAPYAACAYVDWFSIGTNSTGPQYNEQTLLTTAHAPNGINHGMIVSGTMGLGHSNSGLRLRTQSNFYTGTFTSRWYQVGSNS